MEKYAYLSGIRYLVELIDNQVVFTNKELFFQQLVFERPVGINKTPGIWYMTGWESDRQSVPLCHIVAAANYLNENFGESFEPYIGGLWKKT